MMRPRLFFEAVRSPAVQPSKASPPGTVAFADIRKPPILCRTRPQPSSFGILRSALGDYGGLRRVRLRFVGYSATDSS
jgi:hypothetical protein